MRADALLGQAYSLANVVNSVELEGIHADMLADNLHHAVVLRRAGVMVKINLLFRKLCGGYALQFLNHTTSDKLAVGLALAEV